MKKLFAAMLISMTMVVSSAHAVRVVFSEDFEEGIGFWSASNGVWEVGIPTVGPSVCHSGDQCAGTVLNDSYPFTSSRLISEPIQLNNVIGDNFLSMRFWHWFSFGSSTGGNPDWGQVQISVFDPSIGIWSNWTTISNNFISKSGVWTINSIDLTPQSGALIKIGFLHKGSNSFQASSGWYVDDIEIISTSNVVCDIQMSKPSYIIGDTVTAQVARLANPGLSPVKIEVKTWFESNGRLPSSDINIGWDGTFILSAGHDQDYGPISLFTVTSDTTLGTYEYNCRLLDPVTGKPLTIDRNSYDIQ